MSIRITEEEGKLLITNEIIGARVDPLGPRIDFFGWLDNRATNVLFVGNDKLVDDGKFHQGCGDRTWTGPEAHPLGKLGVRTYYPDNQPAEVKRTANSLTFITHETQGVGIEKKLYVELWEGKNCLIVDRTITNEGLWPITTQAWAITTMWPGGTAIVPLPERAEHLNDLAPCGKMSEWRSLRNDGRFQRGDAYLTMMYAAGAPGGKFGYEPAPWVAYVNHDLLMVKRVSYSEHLDYPGGNVQVYADGSGDDERQGFVEIESLSPMTLIPPGQHISLREWWYLFCLDEPITGRPSEETIRKIMEPYFKV